MDHKILIIDDEEAFAECLKQYLEAKGYKADKVTSAGEAFASLDSGQYEIVITDVKMPGITGTTVLKAVKNRSPLCQVIVMSGYSTIPMVIDCLKSGAIDFLMKPFQLSILGDLIDELSKRLDRWREMGISTLEAA